MPEPTDPDFMNIDEVADYLRVPVATLRWWRSQSTDEKPIGPPSGRFVGRLVYRRADVVAWANEQFKTTPAAG